MRKKLFLLAGAAVMFAGTTTAGQPMLLSDAQMDRVAAGTIGSATSLARALGNLDAQTVGLTLTSVDKVHGTSLAMGVSTASASSLLSPAMASSQSAAIARAP